MANSDKNIVITPNINQAAQPNVVFKGQGNVPITLRVLDDSYGTLSFEGSAGQLFSINNNLTSGIIFSVNDVSGIPQIDVNADGTIRIAPFGSSLQIAGLTLGRGSGGIVSNTVLGSQAFASCTTGVNNTAIGQISLANLTTGNNNTGIGSWALGYVSTTSQNTALGAEAGRLNTSGTSLTGVINCIYIGYQSIGTNSASNEIVIGAAGAGKGSNTTVLGNTSTTQTWLYGSAIVLPTTVTIGSQGNDSGVVELYSGTVRLRPSSLGNYIFTLTQRGVDIGAGVGDTVPVLKATRYADGNVGPVAQFVTGSTTHKGLVITGVASQTGNLQEWQNSSGSALLRVTSAGDIVRSGGTADLYIGTDNGYGIVYQADNNGHRFQVWTGSWVDRLVILENGNVGIGTSSPSNLMHIVGNNDNSATYYSQLRIDGTGAYPLNIAGISLNPNDNVQSHIRFLANGTYKAQLRFNQGNLNTNKLSVYSFTTSTDMFTMDCATGYVGIGTYSPTKSLTIAQNGSAPGVLIYKSPDGTLNASQLTAALGSGSSFTNSGTSGGNEYGICQLFHNGTTRVQLYAYDVGVGNSTNFALDAFTFGAVTSFAQVGVVPKSNTTTGLTVRGFTGQTAALQTFQNSSGEVIDFVAADGYSSLHFGEIDWTPNYSGGVSSPSARTYQKTSGNATGWDAQVYSSQGFTKNVHVTFKPSQNNMYFMMGLNSDPSSDASYTSLDYAWYCNNDGYMYIYESGGQVGSNYGTYTSTTLLTVAYDGTNVTYYKDGAIMRQVARAVGNALYLDSSFYTLNAAANSVRFGPFAPNVAAQGTANYVAKFNAANSLVNSSIQDDGTTVTITNALVANSVATPRYYSYNVTAGNAVRLGQWYAIEGNLALHIQVSSDTGGHSGTSSYLYQGGFYVISNTSGQYIKLMPLMIGRGHGDGPDNSISSDSGGWTVFLYTGSTNPAYTMGVAVGIPTGKTNKTLRITITELRGGMTYTADGSSISYPTTSYPYSYQHTYGNLYSNGPIQTAYGPYLGSSGYVSGGFVGVSKWLGLDGQYINIRRLYGVRSFPNTYANGDYVEIAQINRSGGAPITLTIHLGHGAVNGQASAIYQFVTPPFAAGSFTIPPVNYNTDGDIGFDIEAIVTNTYYLNIRARRRSSTTPTYLDFMFSIECHQFNRGGMTEISGTGNSASAIGYGDINQKIGPSVSSPPPAGGSGAGTNLTISASSGVTSGAGGSIILQPGAQATSGGDGQIIIRKSGTSDIGSIFPITNHSVGIQHGSGGTVGYVEIARQGYNGTNYLRFASHTTEGAFASGGSAIFSNQAISLVPGGSGASDSDVPVAIYRRPLLFTYSNFTTTNFGAGLKGSLSNGVIRVCDGTGTTVDSGAGGSLAFASSTASYSANQNDLALTGSAFQRLAASGGLDRTITGIAPPSGGSHVDGRMMRIYNVGSANSLILAHNSTSSAANNRLWCVGQANITIALGDYAELIYDANDNGRGGAGWRVH